jgi:hypothetical protein
MEEPMRPERTTGILLTLVLAMPIALAACGGDDDTDDAGDEWTAEAYCSGKIATTCSYIEGCCTADEAAIFNQTDCEDPTNNMKYTSCIDKFKPSFDAGRLKVNEDAVAVCEAATDGVVESCPNFNLFQRTLDQVGVECGGILEGLVENGGECAINFDCVNGTCRTEDDESPGTCTAFSSIGDACEDAEECGRGNTCIGSVCADRSGAGGPCDEGDHGDCDAELFCDGGACEALEAPGVSCQDDDGTCEGSCDTSIDPPECNDYCNGV